VSISGSVQAPVTAKRATWNPSIQILTLLILSTILHSLSSPQFLLHLSLSFILVSVFNLIVVALFFIYPLFLLILNSAFLSFHFSNTVLSNTLHVPSLSCFRHCPFVINITFRKILMKNITGIRLRRSTQ